MYNILGIFKGLNDNAKAEQLNESVKQAQVYENVEARGDIMEAVKSLEEKFKNFKEGREFKSKDDFDQNAKPGDTYKSAKGTVTKTASGIKHERGAGKEEETDDLDEGIEDKIEAAREKAAAKGKIKDTAKEDPKSASRFVKGKAYGGAAQKDSPEDEVDEAMFPGSGIGKSLRGADQELRGSDGAKMGAVMTPFAGAGAAVGAAAQASMATGAATLFAPIAGAGFLAGAGLVAGTALTYKALQWLARKLFGTTEEALEFAKAHLAAAKAGQPQFQFQGKNYPVKVKSDQIQDLEWEVGHLGIRADQKQRRAFEAAPPGAKAERMVKHVKKGYAKDGALTNKEKAIAYATTWAAHKKGQVEEGAEFGDTFKNSTPSWKKANPTKLKEGRDMGKSQYFDEQVAQALANEQPGMDTSSPKFNEAVYNEIIAQGMTSKAARNIMLTDEDFLGDVATAYGYFCKHNDEVAECDAPMNSQLGGVGSTQELDEIAKLAGLTTEMNNKIPGDSDSPLTHAGCPICEMDPCGCSHEDDVEEGNAFTGKLARTPAGGEFKLGDKAYKDTSNLEEEEMEEGNEFSGALAAAKASGAKEFEVGGKKYTVKESVTLTADGEDVINLIRKLSGMSELDVPSADVEEIPQGWEEVEAPADSEEEIDEERDIEYVNTPREETAPLDAAIPSGTDLNRAKKSYSDKPYRGDNPMAVKEAALWKKYESMINSIKK